MVLGAFFLWGACDEAVRRPAALLALGAAVAVMIPEAVYLPRLGNPRLFWVDFAEETLVAVTLAAALLRSRRGRS